MKGKFFFAKIAKFLTFFEKNSGLRRFVFKSQKKGIAVFDELSIEHTFFVDRRKKSVVHENHEKKLESFDSFRKNIGGVGVP